MERTEHVEIYVLCFSYFTILISDIPYLEKYTISTINVTRMYIFAKGTEMVLLGKKIKDLRKKHKLTQEQFGEMLGVTKFTVSMYENDTRLPSYNVLVKIANTFGVSIDSLLLDEVDSLIDTTGLSEEQIGALKSMVVYFKSLEKS